jgi:outer membrane protein assembly factor BamB
MALDPATGDEVWRVTFDGYSLVPRPIFAADLIVMSTGYDDAQLLAIDPTGQGDVTESHVRWTVTRAAPNNPSPVAIGEDVYFVSDNGILSCVELATGQKRWQERLGGDYSASLLYADGKLYVQDEHGKAFVIRPGKAFELIAENTIAGGARTYASYAATDGALFIRSENDLYRIESPNRVADAKSP